MGDAPPEQRFTDLYRASHGRVLRFVARRVDDDAEAEDLTGEIAALTGLSASAVWVRLHRARQAFKKSYGAEVGHAQR
ncbi:hypothetical protein ACQP2X_13960 [Actinoplanes sp. CA-131856]